MTKTIRLIGILIPVMLSYSAFAAGQQSLAGTWDLLLKDKYFKGIVMVEDSSIIQLSIPHRAEDGAIVPVSISTGLSADNRDVYVKSIAIVVDENPVPLVARFHLNKDTGKADLAMRIRIDKYSKVRAIAELSNGEFYMDSKMVKTTGGCSTPVQGDLKAALAQRGKMKFRTSYYAQADDLLIGQLMVRHPNLTGLQRDQRTQELIPDHYVKHISLSYNGKQILTAETGISVSADPRFRFFFKPEQGGKFTAEVIDSKGETYTNDFDVKI